MLWDETFDYVVIKFDFVTFAVKRTATDLGNNYVKCEPSFSLGVSSVFTYTLYKPSLSSHTLKLTLSPAHTHTHTLPISINGDHM